MEKRRKLQSLLKIFRDELQLQQNGEYPLSVADLQQILPALKMIKNKLRQPMPRPSRVRPSLKINGMPDFKKESRQVADEFKSFAYSKMKLRTPNLNDQCRQELDL